MVKNKTETNFAEVFLYTNHSNISFLEIRRWLGIKNADKTQQNLCVAGNVWSSAACSAEVIDVF